MVETIQALGDFGIQRGFAGHDFTVGLAARTAAQGVTQQCAGGHDHNDGGDRHIHMYQIRLAGGAVFSLRAVHRLTDCETTLADLWDKADSNKDPNEPVVKGSLKQVTLDGLAGLEYETGTAGERTVHRFHCGNKIFYIFNAGYKDKRPADLDRIIHSFHQVNPAHK